MKSAIFLLLTVASCQFLPAAAAPIRAEEKMAIALQLDANTARGAKLYAKQCAECHGDRAQGDADKRLPALAAQRRNYLIKQLADISERERITRQMHLVVARKGLNEPQAWSDLALYLNGIAPTARPLTGNGDKVSLGEASYRQWCASCHEDDARGDDEGFVPSLRNQHYPYLLNEMQALAAGHRFNVDPELARFLNSLQSDEMSGLADYLSRLYGPVRDHARLQDDGSISQ